MKRKLTVLLSLLALAALLLPAQVLADGPPLRIGRQKFADLASAVAAAEPGETITLRTDLVLAAPVTVDKNITLDLDGHILTDGLPESGWLFEIRDGAELSLADSARKRSNQNAEEQPEPRRDKQPAGGVILLKGAGLARTGAGGLALRGAQIFEEPPVQEEGALPADTPLPLVQAGHRSKITIEKGVLSGQGQLILSDGSFQMTGGVLRTAGTDGGTAVLLRSGDVSISGGKIASRGGSALQYGDDALLPGREAPDYCAGKVEITGGRIRAYGAGFINFGGDTSIRDVDWRSEESAALRNLGRARIEGGVFMGAAGAVNARSARENCRAFAGHLVILDGEFSTNDSQRAANGFENNNGTDVPEDKAPVTAIIQGGSFRGHSSALWNSGKLTVEDGVFRGESLYGIENQGTAVLQGGRYEGGKSHSAAVNFGSLTAEDGKFIPGGKSSAIYAAPGTAYTAVSRAVDVQGDGEIVSGGGLVWPEEVRAERPGGGKRREMTRAAAGQAELSGQELEFAELETRPGPVLSPVRGLLEYPEGLDAKTAEQAGLTVWLYDKALTRLPVHFLEEGIEVESRPGLLLVAWGSPEADRAAPAGSSAAAPESVPAPEPTPAPESAPEAFDWQPVLDAIAALGDRGSLTVDVAREIAVPNGVWQGIYGKNITLTLTRGLDHFVFNGQDLKASGFDPDTGHNLTDLLDYIGRSYEEPRTLRGHGSDRLPRSDKEERPQQAPAEPQRTEPLPAGLPEQAKEEPFEVAFNPGQWLKMALLVLLVLTAVMVVRRVGKKGKTLFKKKSKKQEKK